MSLMHSIINGALMRNRSFYDPAHPKDYASARAGEIASAAYMRVCKDVSMRQGELGGVPAWWISREGNPSDRTVLYIHGGGFVTGSSEARKGFTTYVAGRLGLNVISLDYRLAPEHPFPAAPDDCLAAYRALLGRFAADKIALLGESAGGNLVLSLLLQAKAAGLPLPAATFALSPTVQYSCELPSYLENSDKDSIVTNLSDEVRDVYLRSRDPQVLEDPVAAPYFGDYTGCMAVELWVSSSEVLRDDSLALFSKLSDQGVATRLYVRDGMMHTWIIIPDFRESKKDLAALGEDMRQALDGTFAGSGEPIIV